MIRSLYAGISGLRNFQTKMDIIGNNIANVNTVAFKGSRITFADTMSQTLSGGIAPTVGLGGVNPMQVGLGMRTVGVDTIFSQGSLESTGIKTDLALQGDGFFIVSDQDQSFYTRAGTFHIDAEGNLVSSVNGYRVMGHMSSSSAELDATSVKPIEIPLGRVSQAQATSEVKLYGNLDMNMTNSIATLADAGATGISTVNGTARNGVGGQHRIEIIGNNATQSQATGVAEDLEPNQTLGDLGIDDTSGFTVTVDGGQSVVISGLTAESTISALIDAINTQVDGVEAELVGGSIQITRSYHGDGAQYNVRLEDAGDGTIVETLFDNAGELDINTGLASTLVAVDKFTPTDGAVLPDKTLALKFDDRTGLVTGIEDLGGGGITIHAPEGLVGGDVQNPTVALVDTAATTHSTSVFIYDSLGNTHNLTMNLTRSEVTGLWNWKVDVPEPAVVVQGGSGTISFNDDGTLENFTYEGNVSALRFNPANGAQNVEISFNPGSFGLPEGMTQTASLSSAISTSQDGYGMGTLQDIFIDDNGHIFGNFSNGMTELMAQILVAHIINPQGLEKMGENLYRHTNNAGDPNIADAQRFGTKIISGYLEMSNVDLSREFTDMILAQRAFQASSRVITTSDALLDEIIRLKR